MPAKGVANWVWSFVCQSLTSHSSLLSSFNHFLGGKNDLLKSQTVLFKYHIYILKRHKKGTNDLKTRKGETTCCQIDQQQSFLNEYLHFVHVACDRQRTCQGKECKEWSRWVKPLLYWQSWLIGNPQSYAALHFLCNKRNKMNMTAWSPTSSINVRKMCVMLLVPISAYT